MSLLRRAAEAAAELLTDGDLRAKARAALEREAGARVAALGDAAGRARARLAGTPRHARETLRRLQKNLAEQRLQAMLQAERDAPVDVQVGTVLYEDAPQELRSRLWMAVACAADERLVGAVAPGERLEGEGEGEGEGGGRSAPPAPPGHPRRSRSGPQHQASLAASEEAWEMVEDGSAALWGERAGGAAAAPPTTVSAAAGAPPPPPDAAAPPGGRAWGHAREGGPPPPHESPSPPSSPPSSPSPTRLRDALMAAATALAPWPPPAGWSEACLYNTLQQVSVGQEGVDEVIGRDIGRTFPEHPQFGFAQGRAALFRLLRAQALADLEVGYCQGMAFVAGVLLMYLPEEAAFRAMGALLADAVGPDGAQVQWSLGGGGGGGGGGEGGGGGDGEGEGGPPRPPPRPHPPVLRPGWVRGAGLRSLYLPGLEGLKSALRTYEWLLARLVPSAAATLAELGVPPALYAAQWFLTAFACPFPAPFAARVIDALLLERRPDPLIRVALAVAAECAPDLAGARDFEGAVSVLKVAPLAWPRARARAVLDAGLGGRLVPASALAAASAALAGSGGEAPYEGSLARRPSGLAEAAAAARAAAAKRGAVDAAIAAVRAEGRVIGGGGGGEAASGSDSEDDDLGLMMRAVFGE